MFKKKNKLKNTALLDFVNHRPIKYVTARDENGTYIVLGKNGRIIVYEDRIVITCEGKDVFSCALPDLDIGELMSHDGVRMSAPGPDGKAISVIAYYVYRR